MGKCAGHTAIQACGGPGEGCPGRLPEVGFWKRAWANRSLDASEVMVELSHAGLRLPACASGRVAKRTV